MKKDRTDEYILLGILVVPVIWGALLFAPYMHDGLLNALPQFIEAMNHPFAITWCRDTLKTIFIFVLMYLMGIGIYLSSIKNYRRKEGYGSAKWANSSKVNKKYANRNVFENKLFTQHFRLGLDGKKHRRNLNSLIIGGSGAGKTRFYGKPNIMQCNTSFVVLDPKGGARRSYMKSVRTSQI